MNQLSIRFLVVGAIVLSMLIPLLLVGGVAEERRQYYTEAVSAIAGSWGGDQTITGPLLIVPVLRRYTEQSSSGEVAPQHQRYERVVTPETLNIEASITHQYRHRAIYEVPVYQASVKVSGTFTDIGLNALRENLMRSYGTRRF